MTKPIKRPRLKPGPKPADAPTDTVVRQMGRLAAMLAQGKSQCAAAKEMGLSSRACRYWKSRWPAYWKMILAHARETARASFAPNVDGNTVHRFLENGELGAKSDRPNGLTLLTKDSTLDDVFRHGYLPMRLVGCSPRSVEYYECALKHWQRLVGPMPVGKITSRVIAAFQHALSRRLAPASVNAYLRPVKALLRFAADEDSGELIQKAPKVRMLKEPKRVPLALSVGEFARIITEASKWPGKIGGSPAGVWWLALLLVAWETGLRYRALLSIRAVDFVPESGGLYCQPETQKDNEGMWFNLTPDTLRAVMVIYDSNEPLLFHPGVMPEVVGRWFREILDASGIYAPKGCGMRFHRIRKSKASYTEANGGDAQQAMGHSARSVTDRYLDPRIVKPAAQPPMPSPLRPQTKVLLPSPIALLSGPETTIPKPSQKDDAA